MLQHKMKRHWGSIFKGLITIGLMIGFLYFVQEVVTKYLKKETNIKQTMKTVNEFKSPVSTLCFYPPLKPSMKIKYNITKDHWYAIVNSSDAIKSMSRLFEEETYKLGSDFKLYVSNDVYDQIEIKTGANNVQTAENIWKVFYVGQLYSSMYGVCYYIEPMFKVNPKEYSSSLIGISISNSLKEKPTRVTFNLAIKNNTFGAIDGYWIEGDPLKVDMSLESVTDKAKTLYLNEYQYRLLSDPPNCDPTKTYYQCLAEKVFFNESTYKNCPRKCLPIIYTTLKELVSNETIPFCETGEENRCVAMRIWTQQSHLSKTCKRGCHMVQYKGSIASYDTTWNNTNAEIYSSFTAPTVIVSEEYLIYDSVGMIGSVGGSLGLFLGFSFLGLLSDLIDFVQRKLDQVQNHAPSS